MATIISPTTGDRKIRAVGITGMLAVFSGWFLFDAYVGYPRQNLSKAVEFLYPVPEQLPPIDMRITGAAISDWMEKTNLEQASRADVIDAFGEPGWRSEGGDDIWYFGPGGAFAVQLEGDAVKDCQYTRGKKDDIELLWQKCLGFGMLPFALMMIVKLMGVLRTRFELNNQGLIIRGQPMIPFDAMQSLNATKFAKKGILELAYSTGDKTRKVRLDEYEIRDFAPFAAAICERCGFENPLSQNNAEPDSLANLPA